MKEIEIGIKSICPLMMDRYQPDLPPARTSQDYLKQAPTKAYRDAKGNLAIPDAALKAAMRLSAGELGKKMESKKNRELIRACVFVEPEMLSLGKKDYDCIDERWVTRGKGEKVTRVMAYRPLIKEWKLNATISLMDGITPNFIKEVVQRAGIMHGLLSHRPEFGRFELVKFEEK